MSAAALPEGVTVGAYTYGKFNAIRRSDARTGLRVGKFCSIADGVRFLLGSEHNIDWVSTYPFHEQGWCEHIDGHPKSFGDVVVGNDVWIGMDALVLSGAQIGDGAVIAACSVVRGKVPPYAIYGGNPGRILTYRFRTEVIARLLTIAWWDWPPERLRAAARMLSQPDIEEFCNAVERGEL